MKTTVASAFGRERMDVEGIRGGKKILNVGMGGGDHAPCVPILHVSNRSLEDLGKFDPG